MEQGPPVKDKQGHCITREEDKIRRWKEHFETILNREEPRLKADIKEAEQDIKVSTSSPDVEEVKESIKSLKNNRSPGADRVTAEMLKAEQHATPKALTSILANIWEREETPEDWKMGLIVKIPKKGDLGNCSNWRGITLLSLTCKVFSRIVLNRIRKAADQQLRQEQAFFR